MKVLVIATHIDISKNKRREQFKYTMVGNS